MKCPLKNYAQWLSLNPTKILANDKINDELDPDIRRRLSISAANELSITNVTHGDYKKYRCVGQGDKLDYDIILMKHGM